MHRDYWRRPRDSIEGAIFAQWRAVLGHRPTDVDENFFRAGATPADVVRYAARLRQAFGREVAEQVVYDQPTVRRMAAWFRSRGSQRPRVMPLNPEGAGPPLLFLSGATGQLGALGTIAGRDFGRPVFGIESRGIAEDSGEPLLDAFDIARDFADQVDEWRSPLPVHVGGVCTGAVFAFELVRELARRHWPVRSVTLVSPSTLHAEYDRPQLDEFVRNRLAQIARLAGLDHLPGRSGHDSRQDDIATVYHQLRNGQVDILEPTLEAFTRHLHVFAANCYAASRYREPAQMSLPVTVLATATEAGRAARAFWQAATTNKLAFEAFDEHHLDMILSDEVAAALATGLEAVDSCHSRPESERAAPSAVTIR